MANLPWRTTSNTAAMLGFLEVKGAAKDASPARTCMYTSGIILKVGIIN